MSSQPPPYEGVPPPQAGYPPPQPGYAPGAPPPQQYAYPPPQQYTYPPPQMQAPPMQQMSNNVTVVNAGAAPNTVVIQKRGVNHVLHFCITLFFPFWIIVWIILCISE
ncbi:hypothetical protein RRG08_041793 [Elysia crispata]|uniref:Uncharacterized protein n=1 Tax=Elysia crispata TaxID=231223 RepID=A0AAE1B8J4_9GAST|nr:hypothetical protein RRG08_041793 [Elysia crispata]